MQTKKKIVEHNEWNGFLSMVFRLDNWIRLVGAIVVYEAKKMKPSAITSTWGGLQSDVLLLILGVVIMILGPDIRKWILSKIGVSG